MSDGKTIFEGLYQIDWLAMRHINPQNSGHEIPNAIRDLLSDNPQERYDAQEYLFGMPNYPETGGATPLIISFVFEVLALEHAPDRADLLNYFDDILRQKERHPFETSISFMKRYLAAYTAIEAGLDVLLGLLESLDEDIQRWAVRVLAYMSERFDRILPVLCLLFEKTQNYELAVYITETLESLIMYQRDSAAIDDVESFAHRLLETSPSLQIRYLAARIDLVCAHRSPLFSDSRALDVSPFTSDVLVQMFWQVYKPENYENARIAGYLATLHQGYRPLAQILRDHRLHEEDLHLVVKALVLNVLPSPDLTFNDLLRTPTATERGRIYHSSLSFEQKPRFDNRWNEIINEILTQDRFWQTSTNLLSFLVGLPDTRDELRSFLDNNKDQP